MLECVVNISEGRSDAVIDELRDRAGGALLDIHSDPDHNRSVLTLAGPVVEQAAFDVVVVAVERIDVRSHAGVHPRLGAADVVPFVPIPSTCSRLDDAVRARDAFSRRVAEELSLPCFLYGPERSLPEVRRNAWRGIQPDTGPPRPHPTAGAACVGARPVLVAYNVWLDSTDLDLARSVAAVVRGPAVRALAFPVSAAVQVSCNLLDPFTLGPLEVFDQVAGLAPATRGELVGLVPEAVLAAIPESRWSQLGLHATATIEARLREAGLDGGSS